MMSEPVYGHKLLRAMTLREQDVPEGYFLMLERIGVVVVAAAVHTPRVLVSAHRIRVAGGTPSLAVRVCIGIATTEVQDSYHISSRKPLGVGRELRGTVLGIYYGLQVKQVWVGRPTRSITVTGVVAVGALEDVMLGETASGS